MSTLQGFYGHCRAGMPILPRVSVGCTEFDTALKNINDAVKEADDKMYTCLLYTSELETLRSKAPAGRRGLCAFLIRSFETAPPHHQAVANDLIRNAQSPRRPEMCIRDRVEAAMRLLLHREYTLDVIASLCGFSGAKMCIRDSPRPPACDAGALTS